MCVWLCMSVCSFQLWSSNLLPFTLRVVWMSKTVPKPAKHGRRTHTHTHTRVHTDTHNLKQQYTQEAPGSQTKPGSLTFFGEMLDLLHPAVQCQPSNSRPASVPDWTLTSETQQCNIITEHYKETLPLSALYIWMHMNQLAVISGMHAVVWGHILVRICGVKLFCIQNIVWIWWGFLCNLLKAVIYIG